MIALRGSVRTHSRRESLVSAVPIMIGLLVLLGESQGGDRLVAAGARVRMVSAVVAAQKASSRPSEFAGSSRDLKSLLQRVTQGSGAARKTASASLVKLGTDAIGPVAEALLSSTEGEYRKQSVLSGVLIRIGPAVVKPLMQRVAAVGPSERARAKRVLLGLDGPGFGPVSVYLSHDDYLIRMLALDALAEMDGARAVEPSCRVLARDKSELVRARAAWHLGVMGDRRAQNALEKSLSDPDSVVRALAAHALGEMKSKRAVAALLGLLQRDKDANVRESGAWALGEIGDHSAVEPLLKARQGASEDVRFAATVAMAKMGRPDAIHALRDALGNPSLVPSRLVQAADGISAVEGARSALAKARLLALLRHESAAVRVTAAHCLGRMKAAEAVPELIRTLSQKLTRPGALQESLALIGALGHIGDRRGVNILARVLRPGREHSLNPLLRQAAAGSLGMIGDPSACPGLRVALEDEDVLVATASAITLGKMRDTGAIPHLKEAVSDPAPLFQKACREAIVKILGNQAVEQRSQTSNGRLP